MVNYDYGFNSFSDGDYAIVDDDESPCSFTVENVVQDPPTPVITVNPDGSIDASSITDIPDPPNSAAKLITFTFDIKVHGLSSSTTISDNLSTG